jgi:hypothetical protein
VLAHESRQFPSWLIFDVGQKMMDRFMFVGGVFLFLVVVGLPLWSLFAGRGESPTVDSPPLAYWIAGVLVAAPAFTVLVVIVLGFLLPAYGVIARNRLTDVPIWLPPPKGSRDPATLVTASDVGASWLLAAIAATLLVFGLIVIKKGFERKRSLEPPPIPR